MRIQANYHWDLVHTLGNFASFYNFVVPTFKEPYLSGAILNTS